MCNKTAHVDQEELQLLNMRGNRGCDWNDYGINALYDDDYGR